MEKFLAAISDCVAKGNWYAAIPLALALPDICGKYENPKMGSRDRYCAWWNAYLLATYQSAVGSAHKQHTFLSATDAYALRCACLHEGGEDISEQRARDALERFSFVVPPDGMTVHRNQLGKTLQLQVDIFCMDISRGVERWMQNVSDKADVQARMGASLLTVRDISGKPV